jgi:tetratricopeptide (TPR) repeat protein
MGRLDEAVAWDRLAREKSTEAERMGNLSVGLYAEFGDFERARALLDSLPAEHPAYPLTPGFRMMLDEDFKGASEFLVEVVESNDRLPQYVHQIVSDVALVAGDLENARKHMLIQNPVLQLDTELEVNRFTVRDAVKLAYILKQEGDAERSTELLTAALPVVQSLPQLGVFGQGIREAQIYALLGQFDDAYDSLDAAIETGYRSSAVSDQWSLAFDPYFSEIRDDNRFIAVLDRLSELNSVMYQRVLDVEESGDWQSLTGLAGST